MAEDYQHPVGLKQLNRGKNVNVRLDNIETIMDHTNGALHARFDAQDKRLVRLEWMAACLIGAVGLVNLIPTLIQVIKTLIHPA